ncbi:FAD-linked oxidase C-terminal domain-containing protein [Geomesophilobacter sediminis]|uniref:FAD-binding protein n=1 Tax=Geomesophilobacter sediminis TaxID=2798584 RepID=A0A8J7J9Q1_9BACT|nr:FAD-linked oxidase C-terminal domain-containing protein [Geomesophilobacter sediminis]MBJ6723411.1 FAD-binding protein [Geomesophilobacter sediminis]
MDKQLIKSLAQVVGEQYTLADRESLACYGYDSTPELESRPGVVVLPGNQEEIGKVLALCHGAGVRVTPRGSGTNLSGGSISFDGGVILQTSRLNRIIEIDEENLTATVEPGVVTSALHREVEAKGLFYPPDPGSMNISTMGGNVAENSGGLRGLKYGVTADYVMGLKTFLADGELLKTGGKVVKDVAGYNLNQLLVSSEGTLGVFSEITVKLIPKPQCKKTMLVHFPQLEQAALTVSQIIAARIIPATLEFLDRVTIKCVEDYAHVGLPLDVDAVLLIEVDGHPAVVEEEAAGIRAICERQGCSFFQTAATADEALKLATARRVALSALARLRPTTILEDATVPRSAIAPMVKLIQETARKYDLTIGTFGHAGDGNLHPTCLTDERNRDEIERAHRAFAEIFEATIAMGGTITGEHGVGVAKKKYLPLLVGNAGLRVMRGIKGALDPNGILNPGKIF